MRVPVEQLLQEEALNSLVEYLEWETSARLSPIGGLRTPVVVIC